MATRPCSSAANSSPFFAPGPRFWRESTACVGPTSWSTTPPEASCGQLATGLLGYILGHNLPVLYRVLRGILGIGGVVVALVVIAAGAFVVWRRRKRQHKAKA